jgi:exosortase C (VPDSG-CTERM-specific)
LPSTGTPCPRASEQAHPPPASSHGPLASTARRRFLIFAGAWTLLFFRPWWDLIAATTSDALHSYAAAIPAVCAWLIWQDRHRTTSASPRASWIPALGLGLLALVIAGFGFQAIQSGTVKLEESRLAIWMSAWVLGVWAGAFALLGTAHLRQHAFAAAFLLFTIPFPEPLVALIEIGLQHGSSWMVEQVFQLGQVTYLRDERFFWLPGLRFEIAQECSGIRSTVVLFITSLLGGHLLLRAPWRRAALTLAIIPLGLARNTLRICTITLLSVHLDPKIIHSPLHHRGGPLFFAISLIPLFLMLWWFRRQENPPSPPAHPDAHPPASSPHSPNP